MSMPTAEPRPAPGATLGDRVRELRLLRGLTQEELAGPRFTKEYVSQIERNVARPTGATILWLAERLGVDADYLETGLRDELELLERAELALERQDYAAACAAIADVTFPGGPIALRALLLESWARLYLGEVELALQLLDEAEAHVAEDDERAELLYRRGCCVYKQGHVAAAQDLFTAGIGLAQCAGAPDRLRAQLHEWRCRCYRRRRDWPAAQEDVDRALELAEAAGDVETTAHVLFQASLVAEQTGHTARARTCAALAKKLYDDLGDRQNAGRLLNNLGAFEHLLGHSDRAVAHLQESFAIALDLGNEADAAQAVSSLARVALETGDAEAAARHARHAIDLLSSRVEIEYRDELGNVQIVLGRALLELGDLDGAESCFAEAEAAFAELALTSQSAAAWTAQGDLALRRGDAEQAVARYRQAALALHDDSFERREVI
jgi:transcriptional regulator with XRE-family HTH domain